MGELLEPCGERVAELVDCCLRHGLPDHLLGALGEPRLAPGPHAAVQTQLTLCGPITHRTQRPIGSYRHSYVCKCFV